MVHDKFKKKFRVTADDIDVNGHVNNLVYLRWVQDVAVSHWNAAATPKQIEDILWIIRRHEIDYKRPAHEGDEITAATWVGGASELIFERHTEILNAVDGKLLAKAITLWVPVNSKTGKPVRVDNDVRSRFSVAVL